VYLRVAGLGSGYFDNISVKEYIATTATGTTPKGLLIEEQRTNLVTYSEQFDNVAWTKNASSIDSNALVAPDGNLTADKFVEGTTADAIAIARTGLSFTAANTLSVYAKAGEDRYVFARLFASVGNVGVVVFDLQTGTITQTTNQGVVTASGSITLVGNGWYRLAVVASSSGIAIGIVGFILSKTGTPTISTGGVLSTPYTGDGTSGIYVWGAQLEAGAFATSYIPTVASQVTRAADNASMIGNNFARWYVQGPGSLFADVQSVGSVTSRAFTVSNAVIANQIFEADSTLMNVYTGDVFQAQIGGSGIAGKVAMAYATNDFAVAKNGTITGTDTSGSLASAYTQLSIGVNFNNTAAYLNGAIKRIAYYNRRLANTELQGITS
jgi:hypothetical protein